MHKCRWAVWSEKKQPIGSGPSETTEFMDVLGGKLPIDVHPLVQGRTSCFTYEAHVDLTP